MTHRLFCIHCGLLLTLQYDAVYGMQGLCECGFKQTITSELAFTEKSSKKVIGEGVVHEEKTKGFPHECKKCGYDECIITDLGAAYSDESNIYLYECKKCGYVERQADGTGNK